MEVQNEVPNISFLYFASHEGVEDILLKEQSERGIPVTESQRFFAASADVDRENLINRIDTLATLIIIGLFVESPFVRSLCAVFSISPLVRGGLDLFALFESYTKLVNKAPSSLAVTSN